MFTWFEKVCQTYDREKQKELGFERSFMVYDAFKAHKTKKVKVLLATNNTNLVLVPAGCTSKCQGLDVCNNKPFECVFRNFWEDYVTNVVTKLTETEQQRESFKFSLPSRQDIVNWIAEGIDYLKNYPNLIENLFPVCGITTNNPGKVRNNELLKKTMNSVKDKLVDEEEELLEDEDPFSCV